MPAHPRRRPGLRRDALLPIDRDQTRPPPLRRPHRTHQRQRLDPGDHLNSHVRTLILPTNESLHQARRGTRRVVTVESMAMAIGPPDWNGGRAEMAVIS